MMQFLEHVLGLKQQKGMCQSFVGEKRYVDHKICGTQVGLTVSKSDTWLLENQLIFFNELIG